MVYFARSDGRWMIIGSNGGSCTYPAWYYNLKRHTRVTVELGTADGSAGPGRRVGPLEARSLVWPTIVERSPARWGSQRAIARGPISCLCSPAKNDALGGTMRYMLMICDDESGAIVLHLELVARMPSTCRGSSIWTSVGSHSWTESVFDQAPTPRRYGRAIGETLVSDGPFMESKEQIGGFCLSSTASTSTMRLRSPRGHPFAGHGVIRDLRPVWDE